MFRIQDVAYENVEIISIRSLYDTFNRNGGFSFYFSDFRTGSAYLWKITTIAIAILFFLHGAKLSREAVIEGVLHWKLHALVFAFTFLSFPTIGPNGKTCA